MNATQITTIADIQSLIKDHTKIHVIGNGSKPALSTASPDTTLLSLSAMTGITEYQPEEYTITALAGTPVQVIQDALQKNGQYLPFDPMLAQSATIGGTVASNLSGSRRFRYGGIRDFILGAHVVDGQGRAFRCGGKVVKNAAGFDLAKFFVGSLGKYAILTELTFKIFPEAPAFTTLQLTYNSLDDLLSAIYFLNQSVFELDALDFQPDNQYWTLLVRMTGQSNTLPARVERFLNTLKQHSNLQNASESPDNNSIWENINNLSWADDARNVIKVVLSPRQIPAFDTDIQKHITKRRYGVGGSVAWLASDDLMVLEQVLNKHQMSGLRIRGSADSALMGRSIDNVLAQRVKQILDPDNRLI